MRKGLVIIGVLLFLCYICGVLGDDTECSSLDISYSVRVLESKVKTIIISDDYKVLYLLTEGGELYKSTNNGKNWNNQESQLKEALKGNSDNTFVRSIIKTKENGIIYILGFSAVYWTSRTDSDIYDAYFKYVIDIKPHPEVGDCAMAEFNADTCSKGLCYTYVSVTSDFGVTWTEIKQYVFRWEWGSGNTIYLISVDSALETGSQFAIPDTEKSLFISKNLGNTFAYQLGPGYTNIYYKNNFLYVTVITESNLELFISADGGSNFYKADFIDPIKETMPAETSAYQILDSADKTTFINVQLTNDMRFAAIYEADSTDGQFWISLRYNRIDAGKRISDFTKFLGLEGIYYANRYNVSNQISVNNLDPYIETQVTFDKGGVWSRLPVPENSTCVEDNCALHLYGPVDSLLPQILSHPEVVGLVLATGNEGVYRSVRPDNAATYLSRNLGFSWERIRDGINAYSWGDYGALFLLATLESATPQISFSWDQGLSWSDCTFTDDGVDVLEIINVGDSTSRNFILVGTRGNDAGVVVSFDMTNTLKTQCEGSTTPTLEDSDYEVFTPEVDGACLLGKKDSLVRRKRDAVCYNGDFQRTVYSTPSCPCTREDYECDGSCFEEFTNSTTGETTCVNRCVETDDDPQSIPDNCTGVIYITKGYRKVKDDGCSGGLDLDPVPYDCSPPASNTTNTDNKPLNYNDGFLSFTFFFGTIISFLIIVGIIVLFIFYRKNEKLNAIMSPHIPAWCVKTDEEEGDNYGKIDPTTTNSLLDDDQLFE